MKIKIATMSGPDDNVSVKHLAEINKEFPFVEWGILYLEKKMGQLRYPTLNWMNNFCENINNYSVHLCGPSIKNVMVNDVKEKIINKAPRVQLNVNKETVYFSSKIINYIVNSNKNFIIQMNGNNNKLLYESLFNGGHAYPLFDVSGGKGIVPEIWPKPIDKIFCGYAGGLGPANLKDQLNKIQDVVGDETIWVDMESHIRSDNMFDLFKVEYYLNVIKKFV